MDDENDQVKAGRATLKDVAALAGVSRATAARAMNNYGYVGGDAGEKVRAAAEALGYHGNRVAQALRQGQMPLVGFVPGDIQNPFFARIAHDIDFDLRRSKHSLIIASSEEDLAQERDLVGNLQALHVRGMIVAPASDADNRHLARVAAAGMPLVLIDRDLPDLPCDSITVDNAGGAREAVAYLVAQGHRRIAVIHEGAAIVTARQRLSGYLQALSEAGITHDPALIAVSPSTVEHAIDATIRLFSQSDRPTALFTVDSQMTKGALLALRSMGLAIPRDVSLAGFDDFDLATFTDPQITVVAQPVGLIGPLAVKMLLDRMGGADLPPRRTRFPTKLILRGSVNRPAKA